jgi:hypothetical protein
MGADRGVRRVNDLGQADPKGLVGIQIAYQPNQALSEAGVNAPVARRIGVGEYVARLPHGSPSGRDWRTMFLNMPQCRIGSSHFVSCANATQMLIYTREALDLVCASVMRHTAMEGTQ